MAAPRAGLLADNKTKRHFRDLDEAIDVDSEAYCWRHAVLYIEPLILPFESTLSSRSA